MVRFTKTTRKHILMKEVLTFFFADLMTIQMFVVGRKSSRF